jgi:hypothetical protein
MAAVLEHSPTSSARTTWACFLAVRWSEAGPQASQAVTRGLRGGAPRHKRSPLIENASDRLAWNYDSTTDSYRGDCARLDGGVSRVSANAEHLCGLAYRKRAPTERLRLHAHFLPGLRQVALGEAGPICARWVRLVDGQWLSILPSVGTS